MKIRIFALAKELGLDSKDLIDVCAQAGLTVKNSALASISPEERDMVLGFIKQRGTAGGPSEQKTVAPVREATDLSNKMRTIRTMAPRQLQTRLRRAHGEAGAPEDAAPEVAAHEGIGTAVADVDEETPDQAPEAGEAGGVATDAEAHVAAPDVDTTQTTEAPAETARPAMRRDEYLPAAGTMGSSIREMRPRGTVPGQTRPAMPPAPGGPGSTQGPLRRSKDKGRPAMPNVAAPPSYTPPKARGPKAEPAAQKPDIPLSPEMLEQQSPLLAHIQEKKRKKKLEGDETPERRDIRRGGVAMPESGKVSTVRRDRRTSGRRITADDGDDGVRGPRRRRQRGSSVAFKTSAEVETPITVRSLSEAMGRPARDLQRVLMQQGQMATINDALTEELALDLAMELGVDLQIKRSRDVEEELIEAVETQDPEETLVERPPIVTILGHVDHGKTSLLDKIRSANVAAGEAGGITQHIASYQVEHQGKKITFVDTPGHAAFGEMRARGANITDIVVLVVAADDGVMPQTVECISHAKAAGVPIVVAMNKIDLPDTNQQRVLQELAQHDILPAEWGGEVEVVRTSAATGEGIDTLLETLLLTAELNEYKASVDRDAVGVCLEGFLSEGRGAIAWLVVQRGTLKVGDTVLCGNAYGRIRAIYNDRDEELQSAGPSSPVKVTGLNEVPGAGEHFYVVESIEKAREIAASREHRGRTEALSGRNRPRTLDDILTAARGGTVQDLPLIIKADTPGSLEALRGEVSKLEHPEVRVQIIHEGVGGVNESDVYLSSASGAIIVAFHVVAEDRAEQLAEREGVEIRRYSIIYEVTESIRTRLEGMLTPERKEVATGRALVLQTFHTSRFGTIAGCRILNGTIERTNRVHVIRDQTILNDYGIASLRREKDDVKEVREGMECGIRLEGFNDVKEGDLFEAYRIEEVKRTLAGT